MATTTQAIVDAYTAAINDEDLASLVALFADGAMLVNPAGTFTGPDEIRGFYRDVVLAGKAQVSAGDVLAAGNLVMAEIRATSSLDPGAGTAHAVDVFRLDGDGRIARLEIYYR